MPILIRLSTLFGFFLPSTMRETRAKLVFESDCKNWFVLSCMPLMNHMYVVGELESALFQARCMGA